MPSKADVKELKQEIKNKLREAKEELIKLGAGELKFVEDAAGGIEFEIKAAEGSELDKLQRQIKEKLPTFRALEKGYLDLKNIEKNYNFEQNGQEGD